MEKQSDSDLARRLGDQLRVARGRMSQKELIDAVGDANMSYLSEVENGKTDVSVRMLSRYLQGCGWTLSRFFTEMEKRP